MGSQCLRTRKVGGGMGPLLAPQHKQAAPQTTRSGLALKWQENKVRAKHEEPAKKPREEHRGERHLWVPPAGLCLLLYRAQPLPVWVHFSPNSSVCFCSSATGATNSWQRLREREWSCTGSEWNCTGILSRLGCCCCTPALSFSAQMTG